MKPSLLLLLLFFACSIRAEIYKSVDADGHVTYSNIPSKGAKRLNVEPMTTLPKPRIPTPAGMKIDSDTQKQRDQTRYKILADELASEEARLQEARLAGQQVAGDEQKSRKSREDVALHEKNIEALKHEMANVK